MCIYNIIVVYTNSVFLFYCACFWCHNVCLLQLLYQTEFFTELSWYQLLTNLDASTFGFIPPLKEFQRSGVLFIVVQILLLGPRMTNDVLGQHLRQLKFACANDIPNIHVNEDTEMLEQGDASEFLTFVLDQTSMFMRNYQVLPFKFKLRQFNRRIWRVESRCPRRLCPYNPVTYIDQEVPMLLVHIPSDYENVPCQKLWDINSLVTNEFKDISRNVQDDEESHCERCKVKIAMQQSCKLHSFPPRILIVQIKRQCGQMEGDTLKQMNVIDSSLLKLREAFFTRKMKTRINDKTKIYEYELIGFVLHISQPSCGNNGHEEGSGHYVYISKRSTVHNTGQTESSEDETEEGRIEDSRRSPSYYWCIIDDARQSDDKFDTLQDVIVQADARYGRYSNNVVSEGTCLLLYKQMNTPVTVVLCTVCDKSTSCVCVSYNCG